MKEFSGKRLESLLNAVNRLNLLGSEYDARSVREAYHWIKAARNVMEKDSQLLQIECQKIELASLMVKARFVALMLCCEWYGAAIDDDERQILDECFKAFGFPGGLSEDTFYEECSEKKVERP